MVTVRITIIIIYYSHAQDEEYAEYNYSLSLSLDPFVERNSVQCNNNPTTSEMKEANERERERENAKSILSLREK